MALQMRGCRAAHAQKLHEWQGELIKAGVIGPLIALYSRERSPRNTRLEINI
jgi:hypothetical protein